MLTFRWGGLRLELHWSFLLMAGLAAALPRTSLPLLGLLAALCHELGHLAAMTALGLTPRRLRLTLLGGRLSSAVFPGMGAELAALAAGASANLALAGLFRWGAGEQGRLFSALNLVLGCFNLLPVAGLDGGRMIELVLGHHWGEERGRRTVQFLSILTLAALWGWCFWLWNGHPHLPGLLAFPLAPLLAFLQRGKGQ